MNYPNPGRGPAREQTAKISVSDIRFGDGLTERSYADIPEQKAQFIADNSNREANKPTQLRRFYDELCLWHEKVNLNASAVEKQSRYQEFAPLIKMLKAKVAYAEGRKHVDENFRTLFAHCIDQIKDARTLGQCKLFFEAFMGFYKAVRPN